jgi:glutamate carboxypeptidase
VDGLIPADAAAPVAEARALLEALASIESPSGSPGVVAALERYRTALEGLGVRATLERSGGTGDPVLLADVPGADPERRPLLVVGHLDTVHPVGTLAGPLPLREVEEEGVRRLYGPGVYDMKGGLAALVGALLLLRARGMRPGGSLRVLVTPDEEVGAPASRPRIEAEARTARGALVLEPPIPGGGPKIRRKGVGQYRIQLLGEAAHAGIEPGRGASAIHALADLLPRLLALQAPDRGTTVNVGRVTGGGPVNVVADRVELDVDVRVSTAAETSRIEEAVQALGAHPTLPDPRIRVTVEGGVDRPPLEPTPESLQILEVATAVARRLGRPAFEGGATGGASDGNLLAAAGCPVLDGLGPDGDGAHTHREHILLDDFAWRVAFLADLLAEL